MFSNLRQRISTYLEPTERLQFAAWSLYAVCRDRIRFHGLGAFSGATKWRDEAFALWYRTLKVQILRYECSTVVPSLVASAEGTILELGPGAGNHIPMFDQEKVRHIYGIETNDSFMLDLQALITLRQLEEKYTVIHAAVEDTDVLEKHGIVSGSIDTIVSMQVFCSARKPDAVAKELYRLLKPGGKLIFWEHHRSHDLVTWIVQNIWNVPWSFFLGGCNLNRDIDRIIRSAGTWENADEIEDTEQEKPWSMMPRVWGTLVKPIKM
ncbi:S-adenosyl-L-methionine-dependent methyltransferase [Hypoxylon sp. NC1633]|nr:S-adenosyl-L-methionine-dependent methyltransferase [Hypoxylon sp. NC1633]